MKQPSPARHAPATLRNREPILAVLRRTVPSHGLLLEVASGTGEHAAFMAPRLPGRIEWQPTEADERDLAGIDAQGIDGSDRRRRPAIVLDARADVWPVQTADAVLCCNMIHIAPWAAAVGLFAGAARVLPPGGPLILYGPYRRHGQHTAPSNAAFDESLRRRDPAWGVRCLDSEVAPMAERWGLRLEELVEMPANNLTVVFRREAGLSPAGTRS